MPTGTASQHAQALGDEVRDLRKIQKAAIYRGIGDVARGLQGKKMKGLYDQATPLTEAEKADLRAAYIDMLNVRDDYRTKVQLGLLKAGSSQLMAKAKMAAGLSNVLSTIIAAKGKIGAARVTGSYGLSDEMIKMVEHVRPIGVADLGERAREDIAQLGQFFENGKLKEGAAGPAAQLLAEQIQGRDPNEVPAFIEKVEQDYKFDDGSQLQIAKMLDMGGVPEVTRGSVIDKINLGLQAQEKAQEQMAPFWNSALRMFEVAESQGVGFDLLKLYADAVADLGTDGEALGLLPAGASQVAQQKSQQYAGGGAAGGGGPALNGVPLPEPDAAMSEHKAFVEKVTGGAATIDEMGMVVPTGPAPDAPPSIDYLDWYEGATSEAAMAAPRPAVSLPLPAATTTRPGVTGVEYAGSTGGLGDVVEPLVLRELMRLDEPAPGDALYEARKRITDSPEFAAFKKERGYQDDRFALRQFMRESRFGGRQARQEDRRTMRLGELGGTIPATGPRRVLAAAQEAAATAFRPPREPRASTSAVAGSQTPEDAGAGVGEDEAELTPGTEGASPPFQDVYGSGGYKYRRYPDGHVSILVGQEGKTYEEGEKVLNEGDEGYDEIVQELDDTYGPFPGAQVHAAAPGPKPSEPALAALEPEPAAEPTPARAKTVRQPRAPEHGEDVARPRIPGPAGAPSATRAPTERAPPERVSRSTGALLDVLEDVEGPPITTKRQVPRASEEAARRNWREMRRTDPSLFLDEGEAGGPTPFPDVEPGTIELEDTDVADPAEEERRKAEEARKKAAEARAAQGR